MSSLLYKRVQPWFADLNTTKLVAAIHAGINPECITTQFVLTERAFDAVLKVFVRDREVMLQLMLFSRNRQSYELLVGALNTLDQYPPLVRCAMPKKDWRQANAERYANRAKAVALRRAILWTRLAERVRVVDDLVLAGLGWACLNDDGLWQALRRDVEERAGETTSAEEVHGDVA